MNPINYNLDAINSRLQRLKDYFPNSELRSIISDGVSKMDPKEIRKEHINASREGRWFGNLMKWVRDVTNTDPNKERMIGAFIIAFAALEGRQEWGEWEVDSDKNDWSAIWIRLTDKALETCKRREFKLSTQDDALLQAIYLRYKDGKHGVDERRKKHDQYEKEFTELFGAEELAEVNSICRQKAAESVTPKHCGLYLLEVDDPEERSRLITQYYSRLTACAKAIPLAKKLADYFQKHIGEQYTKLYDRPIAERDVDLVKRLDVEFRKALA